MSATTTRFEELNRAESSFSTHKAFWATVRPGVKVGKSLTPGCASAPRAKSNNTHEVSGKWDRIMGCLLKMGRSKTELEFQIHQRP